MPKDIVVQGRFSDSTHIKLDKPVKGVKGKVEIRIRVQPLPEELVERVDTFEFIRNRKPGTRSKEDIDRQIQEERDEWDA